MDREQQKQVNEAAEKFADAIKESYQALAQRGVSAQELNAQLTQDFFNRVINNLRTQAENNRALAEDLIEQQRKQQEASQQLTQESVNAYMDFLNSMFSQYREGTQRAAGSAQEGARAGSQAIADVVDIAAGATQATAESAAGQPPIDGYDEMNVGEITRQLGDLTVLQLQEVKHYEKRNKNRSTLIEAIDFRLTGSA